MEKASFTLKKRAHEWRMLFSSVKSVFSTNLGCILLYVLLYTIFAVLFFDTVSTVGLRLEMMLAGIEYIGPDTLFPLLVNMKTLPITFLFCLLLLVASLIEIAGILHACSMGLIGKKTSVPCMLTAALHATKRALYPKNWLLLLFLLILMPMTGIFALSGSLFCVEIPEFIMDYITANGTLNIAYKVFYVILLFVEATFIFSLNIFVMEKKTFLKSCKQSFALIKGNYLRVVLFLLVAALVSAGFFVCLSALVSEGISAVAGWFGAGAISQTALSDSALPIAKGILISVLNPVVNLTVLTVMYFQLIEERDELIRTTRHNFNDKKPSRPLAVGIIAFAVLVVGAFGWLHQNDIATFHQASQRPAIVAHRGDSILAPENTMPAFRLAVMEKLEWVELDVQQTKDGVVIVSHDDDLTRVARKTLFVHELTYAETQELDVGSWFSPEFSDVRLSTLDEVLDLFQDTDIKLQIEIKINGFEDHLEEKVLASIDAHGMQDQTIITSLQPEPLKRILELDPDRITTYSMYVAGEGVEHIAFSKYLTIEESNFTKDLVDRIHAEGKTCFAWTANTEDTIQYLVDCGVDGILTDNPLLIRNALDHCDYSGGMMRFLRLMIHRLSKGL